MNRRWLVIMFIVVTTVLFVFGGVFSVVTGLLPEDQKQGVLPLTIGFGVTYGLLTIVITLMQWFGISPVDFLPEKTLKQQDRGRYKKSQTKDVEVLKVETVRAIKNTEYEWAVLFADIWIKLRPSDEYAYNRYSQALLKLSETEKSIELGQNLVKIKPLDYTGYEILGNSYAQLANWDDAKKWYEEALKYATDGEKKFIHYHLAEVYEGLVNIEGAINSLAIVLDMEDDQYQKISIEKKIERLKRIKANLQKSQT